MPWQGDSVSPWQARTKTFESKNAKVSLVISTHRTNGIGLQQRFSDEIDSGIREGARINYSVIKDNWFVVSGTNSLGFEFGETLANETRLAQPRRSTEVDSAGRSLLKEWSECMLVLFDQLTVSRHRMVTDIHSDMAYDFEEISETLKAA
jgi:hypothetical protein